MRLSDPEAALIAAANAQVDEWHGKEIHDGYCERPLCLAVLALRAAPMQHSPAQINGYTKCRRCRVNLENPHTTICIGRPRRGPDEGGHETLHI